MTHPHYFCVYDIETSGLSPGKPEEIKSMIMEFAAIILDPNLVEVERVSYYIKPYTENPIYSPQALAVHNIPVEKTIEEGIELANFVNNVVNLFKKYSGGARKKMVISGHNIIKFDNSFMKVAFELYKKQFEDLYEFEIDTLIFSHLKYGHKDDMLNFKLGTACSKEDISIIGAHRAMKDVEANTKLLIKYLTDLRSDSSSVIEDKEEGSRAEFYF